MGGDHGPKVVVPAALKALEAHPDVTLILVGDEAVLARELKSLGAASQSNQLRLHHASEIVEMDESPVVALRGKKDSSMRVSINLVKNGEAQACVSTGNTGALMATAKFVLKTVTGIDRPAIIAETPVMERKTRLVDLGANVDSCAEHLFQFAVMGSVLASAIDNIERPSVALLNIGVEDIKGNDQVKRTAQLLSDSEIINYVGYVESTDIFKGTTDIVVCDGFVGNIALKSAEGIANLLLYNIKKGFSKNLYNKALAMLTKPIFDDIKNSIDPSRYNGASMLGLNGIVVKSHGSASVKAHVHAIENAIVEVKHDVPRLIHDEVLKLYNEGHLV